MATHLAREGFSFPGKNGIPRFFAPGDPIDDSDPDLKGREHLFEPSQEATDRATNRLGSHPNRAGETASAAPGEMRVRTKPHPTPQPQHDK